MSPASFNSSNWTNVFVVYSNGIPTRADVSITHWFRPVINLKADLTITGSGTSTDPYTVS